MPNRTYIVGGGDVRQLEKGTKAMKAKDPVTAVFVPTLLERAKFHLSSSAHLNSHTASEMRVVHFHTLIKKKHGWTRNDINTGGLMCFFRASVSLRQKKLRC